MTILRVKVEILSIKGSTSTCWINGDSIVKLLDEVVGRALKYGSSPPAIIYISRTDKQ
jgi:hypothetical protein